MLRQQWMEWLKPHGRRYYGLHLRPLHIINFSPILSVKGLAGETSLHCSFGHMPMPWAPVYIGRSRNGAKRAKGHNKHADNRYNILWHFLQRVSAIDIWSIGRWKGVITIILFNSDGQWRWRSLKLTTIFVVAVKHLIIKTLQIIRDYRNCHEPRH